MPRRKDDFSPVLKEGNIWQVVWWVENGDKRHRIRRSKTDSGVDLNAIPDLKERRRVAEEWILQLKKRLKPKKQLGPEHTVFIQALMDAVALKSSPKPSTMDSYRSNARWLCDYFQESGWAHFTCVQVSRMHIQDYFDYLILRRKVSNTTHNTRKNNLRALFTELVRRGFIPENYVSAVPYRQEQDTIRRPISEQEEEAIVQGIGNDRALAFGYVAQRYLGVRPDEIRHLRVGHFRFDAGMLVFPGKDSKNNRNSPVTIPDEVLPTLRQLVPEEANQAFFVLGCNTNKDNPAFMPRPVMIGENTLSEKFRALVRRLHKAGVLQDITGVQFYSLKDTLAVYMLDNGVDVESAMRHLRQRDLEVFQRYVKRLGTVNEKIKRLPVRVSLPEVS